MTTQQNRLDQKWINFARGANKVTDFGISFSAVNATLKMD